MMPDRCHIDFETYSDLILKDVGVYRYVEHKSFDINCMAYCFDDGPVKLWIPDSNFVPTDLMDLEGYVEITPVIPFALRRHIERGGEVAAHNAMFERVVSRSARGRSYGFPPTRISQWVCTEAKCAVAGLPRGLGDACKVVDTPNKKDEVGRFDMLRLAKPYKSKRIMAKDEPDRYLNMYRYCIDDVMAERDLDHMVPDLTGSEKIVYNLDQRINDRGVRLDLEAVKALRDIRDKWKAILVERCLKVCGIRPSQNKVLADWLREEHGVPIKNMQAPTVRRWLKRRKHMPDQAFKALFLYASYNMTTPAKLDKMLGAANEDGRIRGMLKYYGASPGRWTSRIVQLQNLFRSVLPKGGPDDAIEIAVEGGYDDFHMLYGDSMMPTISSCIRGMIVPAPGKDLICVDYSSIEARLTAWLAYSDRLMKVHTTHGMIYEYTAAQIYHKPTDEESLRKLVSKDERFIGKIATLSMGFGGGVGAFMDALEKNDPLVAERWTEEQVGELIDAWRDENPEVRSCWRELVDSWAEAVKRPNKLIKAGRLAFLYDKDEDYMRMRLPGGRCLNYYQPQAERRVFEHPRKKDEAGNNLVFEGWHCTYQGVDSKTNRWMRIKVFGGKLLQNATEAIGRDILVRGAVALENHGKYRIISMTHDEFIAEVDSGEGDIEEMVRLACPVRPWMKGLPVEGDGFIAKRYRKD